MLNATYLSSMVHEWHYLLLVVTVVLPLPVAVVESFVYGFSHFAVRVSMEKPAASSRSSTRTHW